MRATVLIAVVLAGCSNQPPRQETKADVGREPPKILHFYASPGQIARGETITICYGVENTDSVSIRPPVEQLRPSSNRCIQDKPERTTTYTLVARGSGGAHSKSLTVTVGAPAAKPQAESAPQQMIQLFAASASEVPGGSPVTLCYGVRGAKSVRLEPPVRQIEVSEKHCFLTPVPRTTTYKLVAVAPDGHTEFAELTVTAR